MHTDINNVNGFSYLANDSNLTVRKNEDSDNQKKKSGGGCSGGSASGQSSSDSASSKGSDSSDQRGQISQYDNDTSIN